MRLKPLPLALLVAAAIAATSAVRLMKPAAPAATPAPTATAEAARPRAALTVTVATARVENWALPIEASGSVMPWQEAVVSARVVGLPLAEVAVNVGDVVSRGQVLARFEDASVRAELAQAQASLAEAEAAAHEAATNRERAQTLLDRKVLTPQDLLRAATLAETTRARAAQARAALDSARIKLENTVVTAPDAGSITARDAVLGMVPGMGAELFRLIRQQRLEWRPELKAEQLSQVKPGMGVVLELPEGGQVRGTVRQAAPMLESSSRMGLVYADLEPSRALRGAMYLSGRIELPPTPALVVPVEAVVIRDGRSYLHVVQDSRVQRVPVTPGRRMGALIEIVQGLQEGQSVAVRGSGFLADGDTVSVVAEPAAAQAPAGG